MRKRVIHLLRASAFAALFLAVAFAPAAGKTVTIEVRHDDLDLSSDAGLAELRGRMRGALAKACGRPSARIIREAQDWERCRETAAEQLRRQLIALLGPTRAEAFNADDKIRS